MRKYLRKIESIIENTDAYDEYEVQRWIRIRKKRDGSL